MLYKIGQISIPSGEHWKNLIWDTHYGKTTEHFGVTKFHVPNFSLGHNGLITFTIFLRFCQIDTKGQIIANEKYLGFGIRGIMNDVWTLEWHKYLIKELNK